MQFESVGNMGLFDVFKKKENYEQKYFEQCKYIWKNYVPKRGQADSLQGELLRQLEKLRCEAQDNGNANWGEDYSYFCDFINETLCNQIIYVEEEKRRISLVLNYIKKCGCYAHDYHVIPNINNSMSDRCMVKELA